jgi:hypothetical protein
MGDRGNVFVLDSCDKGNQGVFLYSHWEGSDLPFLVKKVLSRKERWNDYPYLTRMVFSAMVANDIGGSVGYGISTTINCGEHPVIVIDCENQSVGFCSKNSIDRPFAKWRFDDYIEEDDRTIKSHYED